MPATPFLGQIIATPYNFAPRGWALCNGQILAISQNTALFSLLGTYYGGNGTTTFALPDLQGRTPIAFGQGLGLSNYDLGEVGGVETVSLLQLNNPQHSHGALAFGRTPGDTGTAASSTWARSANADNLYQDPAGTPANMAAVATSPTGSGQPHENHQPFLTLNYIIALQGIYPQRN
jgi:microcystin-dependent protein